MGKFPASVAAYGKPGGGDVGRRRSARAARISAGRCARSPTDGADAFYKGWIADRIAEDMAANGGLITKEDLAAYQAKERTPVQRHLSAASRSSRCRRRAPAASR